MWVVITIPFIFLKNRGINVNDIIWFFTVKYKGDWERIYKAIDSKESINKEEFEDTLTLKKDNYICMSDREFLEDSLYPSNFEYTYKPPFSLFWKGNIKLFEKQLITLSNFTKKDFKKIVLVDDLKNHIVFVIDYNDENLVNYLINEKYNFVAILNQSIESVCDTKQYQQIVDNDNLVLTEYPFSAEKDSLSDTYLRIITGLSRIVLLGNDTSKSKLQKIEKICLLDEIKTFSIDDKGNLNNFGFAINN